MFFPNRIIAVFVLVGIGIAPQFATADSPHSRKDLLSMIRSYQSPVAKHEERTDGASATPNHRLAKTYASQNDAGKANTHFGLALQNATAKQIPTIATDYATFLTETGDLRKAEIVLRQALTQVPNDTELTKKLARCLVLQDKMIEGLRYFKTVYSEAEAKAEIAAIYREQGDTDSLAVVEQRWGTPKTARPEPVRSEPVLIAATPKPVVLPLIPKARPFPPPPTEIVNTVPRTMRTPSQAPAVVASEEVAVIVAPPIEPPRSKPELYDTKIPMPTLNSAPQPVVATARLPKPAPTALVPKLPAPMPLTLTADQLVLENPVKLAMVPTPPDAAHPEVMEPPRPTVITQPRKHYVVNANSSADLDALFPVEPATATLPVQKPERLMFVRR